MMNIVIVGAGMAGCKLAESLVNAHQGNMNITLVSEEAQVGYNRILLSSLLAQDITEDQLAFVDITKLKAKGVTVLSGDPAVSINNAQNLVSLRSGKKLSYDKLVLATGSQPTHLPVFDSTAKNVMAFRTWEDANTLAALPAPQNIAVIGAGLLGLEAAVGLAKKGHIVTVFHRAIHIMNRQLDSTAANLLQTNLERMGVRFCLTDTPQAALTNTANHVTHLTRKNGSSIVVDLVILAVGISPEVSLAKTASLAINRAIIVNAQMQSSADDIYALGECCEFEQTTFGLVAPIWQQVQVLTETLLSRTAQFQLDPTPTSLKVSGVSLFSMGDISESEATTAITFVDASVGHYRKLIIESGVLVGAILIGNVTDGGWYTDLISQKTNITPWLDRLIFGQAYCVDAAA